MPWFWIFILVVGLYLVVKMVQGIRDLVSWWVESRDFARLRQESIERARQGHQAKPPPLKERPAPPVRPPKGEA